MTLCACVIYLQSSALGFLLAQKHFTNPLVAVPSAVSVVCMAVSPCFPWCFFFEYNISCFLSYCVLSYVYLVFVCKRLTSLSSTLQLGGSALAVYWRNQPIPIDDKDDFKE